MAGVMASWNKHKGWLVSVFVLAVILPVFLIGAAGTNRLRVFTRADENTELRLWFEPERVETVVGRPVELTLVADYDDQTRLIPAVELRVRSSEGLVMESDTVRYLKSFYGRVVVGTVKVRGTEVGEYKIEVIDGSVNTKLPDLPVTVGTAMVSVK